MLESSSLELLNLSFLRSNKGLRGHFKLNSKYYRIRPFFSSEKPPPERLKVIGHIF